MAKELSFGYFDPDEVKKNGLKLIIWIFFANSCLFTGLFIIANIVSLLNFPQGLIIISLIVTHILAYYQLRKK